MENKNYVIEQLNTQPMVFMRRIGAYGAENNVLMESLKKWAKEKGVFTDCVIYGIAQDNPANTPPEQCRYDVCLVADADYSIDGSVQSGEIPGGKYAVFLIPHTIEAVQEFWRSFITILRKSKIQTDLTKPILERYNYKLLQEHKCEFCVPII